MVDHFQDKQCLYIILERCDGGELMQRIQQDNIFSEKVASAYFRQILQGVQHCHRRLVVHRCRLAWCICDECLGEAS
jgi:serine/threonine protein kinase